jgi:hypothetical protein
MWRLIAPALAFALLGASFFRAGNEVMVLACLGLLALLAVPRRWAALVAQSALLLGALRWIALAWMIGAARAAAGAPWTRMALILGAVALFTLLAALVFRSARLRAYYRPPPGPSG